MRVKTTMKVVVFYLLVQVYFTQSEANTKYTVLKGLSTSATSGSYTTESVINCAAYMAVEAALQDVYPMATYNKNTSACKIFTSLPENIVLKDSSENDYVIWDMTSCTVLNDVYREYIDKDLYSFDQCVTPQLSIDDCIANCRTTCSGFKSIEYNYGYTSSSGGGCHCKYVSKQGYQEQGYTLNVLANYAFYEMLCLK